MFFVDELFPQLHTICSLIENLFPSSKITLAYFELENFTTLQAMN